MTDTAILNFKTVYYNLSNIKNGHYVEQTSLEVVVQARNSVELEMWANAQRDGRPAEYRWRPLSTLQFG